MQARILILITFLFSLPANSQDIEKPNWTIRMDFQVPQPLKNKAFKTSFTGIMDLGAAFCFGYKGVFLGPFYRYKQFQVQANKIKNITTMQLVHNAGLKIGYDNWLNDKTNFSTSVNIGYNQVQYNRVICAATDSTPQQFTGVNLEPNLNMHFMIDEGFGIGLMLSYNVFTYVFDPEPICLDQYHTYNDSDKQGLTQSFSFGFCVYYDLARKAPADY